MEIQNTKNQESIEILAGKLDFNPETQQVTADKRLGNLKLVRILEEKAYKIEWRERNQEELEIERYLFQGDTKVEISAQMKRVIIFSFISDNEKQFFWIQEPDSSKDAEIIKSCSEFLNKQFIESPKKEKVEETKDRMINQAPQTNTSNNTNSNLGSNFNPSNQTWRMPGINPFGGLAQNFRNPGTNPNPNGTTNPPQIDPNVLSMLQQFAMQNRKQQDTPSLHDLFTSDFLKEVAEDKEFQEVLMKELPEIDRTPQGLSKTLKCPQFQQCLEQIDDAINRPEGGASILTSFGYDATTFLNTLDGNKALFEGLIKEAKDKKEQQEQQ